MILGHSREARKELGEGRGEKRGEEGKRGEKRESEKETMNNAYCHKHKIRIRKFLPELATRSPVVD